MLCRLSDLRDKEVVNINNGSCMGCVSDVEIDTCCAYHLRAQPPVWPFGTGGGHGHLLG